MRAHVLIVERAIYDSLVEGNGRGSRMGCGSATRLPRRDADGAVDFGTEERETVSSFVNGRRAGRHPRAAPRTGPVSGSPPTVLCPVDPASRAAREEIFGPVATVIPVRRRG